MVPHARAQCCRLRFVYRLSGFLSFCCLRSECLRLPPFLSFAPQKAWNVVLVHKPTKKDALKVSYNHSKEANLEFAHTEGIAKITLKAPIKSGATVSANLTLEKSWDL